MKTLFMILLFAMSHMANAEYLDGLLENGDQLVLNTGKKCQSKKKIIIHDVELKYYGFEFGPNHSASVCWNHIPGQRKIAVFTDMGDYREYSILQFKKVRHQDKIEIGD